jgi:hypothetical protein
MIVNKIANCDHATLLFDLVFHVAHDAGRLEAQLGGQSIHVNLGYLAGTEIHSAALLNKNAEAAEPSAGWLHPAGLK